MMPRRGRTRTEARWLIGLLRDSDDDDDDHNLQSAEKLIWDVFELCGSKMLILIMMTMMMMVWTDDDDDAGEAEVPRQLHRLKSQHCRRLWLHGSTQKN